MNKNNTHETLVAHSKIKKKGSDKSFGLVFAVLFAIIALVPLYKQGDIRWWSFAISGIFLITSFVAPKILGPLNSVWLKFGDLLHSIVSPVIMGLIFYLVVSPTGLVMRIFSKVPLKLMFDRDATSYWIVRDPPGPDPEGMRNQF